MSETAVRPHGGADFTLEKRCDECSSWDEELMTKYVKHRKSLLSKSRSRSKDKKPSEVNTSSVRSRSSSEDLCATPAVSGDSDFVSGISEARVDQLISTQINKLSVSFAASMEASFVAVRHMIDDKLGNMQMLPTFLFQPPRQYRSDCPLARDETIPPSRAPVQDMVLRVG